MSYDVYDKVHITIWSSSAPALLGAREVREVRRGARVAALGRALEELRGLGLVYVCSGAASPRPRVRARTTRFLPPTFFESRHKNHPPFLTN